MSRRPPECVALPVRGRHPKTLGGHLILNHDGRGRCLLARLSRQNNGAMTAARTKATNRRSSADCSSQAMAGTPTASTIPTRQIRHDATWTPAVKVPRASTVNAANALASAFIMRPTSATNTRCIARRTAPQCSACVQMRRKRCSRFSASRHRVMTQMTPMKGARTIQYVVMGELEKLVYATPKSARIKLGNRATLLREIRAG